MDRSERLSQDFDLAPVQGIGIGSNSVVVEPEPQVVEAEETAIEPEVEATETASEETTAESQVEETEVTDEETQEDDGLDMSIGQFANAAGVTLKDIYNGVKMPDGRTLSQAVDEGNERQAQLQTLQTERNKLQEQLQNAQSQAVQTESPEVLELEMTANLLQKALENADFSQMEQGAAANYRIDQSSLIQQYRQAAQAKRVELQGKQFEQMGKALMEANTVMLSKVPEWASADVSGRENKAMGAYLVGRGFTAEDLQVIDRTPKLKLLVRDAWKSEAKQAEIKKGAQKVRKITKTLKPGAMKGSVKGGLKDVAKAVKQAGTRAAKQQARLLMQFDR